MPVTGVQTCALPIWVGSHGRRGSRLWVFKVHPAEVLPDDVAKTRPLALTNVKVAGGSRGQFGASYRLSFNATQAADVEVEVQSFGGRTVRRLQTRASGVGETGVVWDGRDGQGATLPAGAYILVLTARDETGATVRQAVPFVSVR